MSFSQHLVLWLHVTFVAFTIGPVTLAIMSTPRYIRQADVRIVRYLSRITLVFTVGSLGVLIAGMFLAQMLHKAGKPWIIISATLFLVAILMLALIVRDQRHAIRALEEAGGQPATAGDQPGAGGAAGAAGAGGEPADEPGATAADGPADGGEQPAASPAPSAAGHLASVERGRIAMIGGLVSVIWLVILVLMVWNS